MNTVQLHTFGEVLSIGSPTPNNNVYILDEAMHPVPIGQAGVMWAGGAGISRGYVNLPEKTAERYKVDVFTDDGYVFSLSVQERAIDVHSRSYMFNTGDLGRWRPDGRLDHLGRVDDQVKVKVRLDCIRNLVPHAHISIGFPCRTGWRIGGYGGAASFLCGVS